jgi:1,4-dihydroxy-2-naphthoate octaprenyltransferase
VYEDNITTLYTGGRMYETVDSPINRSPLGPAVVLLTCGGLYFVMMVAIRRKRLLSDARVMWTLWAGPGAAA